MARKGRVATITPNDNSRGDPDEWDSGKPGRVYRVQIFHKAGDCVGKGVTDRVLSSSVYEVRMRTEVRERRLRMSAAVSAIGDSMSRE